MALYINFIPPFCWYEMNEFLSDAISLKVRQYPKIAVHALTKAYGVASQMVVIVQHRLPSIIHYAIAHIYPVRICKTTTCLQSVTDWLQIRLMLI